MIDPQRVISDTGDLVRIDSQNPGPMEYACADWVEQRLRASGLTPQRREVRDGRENVVAVVPGAGTGPRFVLVAHMDTVPVGDGWSVPPLEGLIRDGKLYGRGACDMKGGVALALNLVTALAEQRITPPGDVVFAATVDEEAPDMAGIHELVEHGVVTAEDQVLALEPSAMRLRIAQMGLRWMTLTVHGRNAHAGRAHLGIDANHVAARIVDQLKREISALEHEDPLLGRARFTCGVIQGGVATNVVPSTTRAMFDVRLVPPMTIESTVAMVHAVADDVIASFPGASYELEGLGAPRPPVRAADDAHVVQTLEAAYAEVTGAALPRGDNDGHEAYTDASMVSALTGSTNATVFGPGTSDLAHSPDEHVPIADLELGAQVLDRMIARW
ncbi:MAG: M20 family metallopeptidase [Nitriliruptoraceae bacterium]|nr:M20 family metallopeptidase [Nitriliruptoraceae bacterium]